MTAKPAPTRRAAYAHFITMPTRWHDNDAYGHMNNVVYYSYFESAVSRYLIERGVLDVALSTAIPVVVDTRCTFFSSIFFPDLVHTGLKVIHLGKSSVRYETALFRNECDEAAAVGQVVHVYVDRVTNRPVPILGTLREVLAGLVMGTIGETRSAAMYSGSR